MEESKRAFKNFKYVHQGEEFIFRDYANLKTYRLTVTPCILIPLTLLLDSIERAKERKLEKRYDLPDGYLSGLMYKVIDPRQWRLMAARLAREYHYLKLQREVQRTIDRYLPSAMEHYARQSLTVPLFKPGLVEPAYHIMEPRYSVSPTHQGPCCSTTIGQSPQASAPPLVYETMALVHSGPLDPDLKHEQHE